MRALSEAAAARCENATRKRCDCRCDGAMHGKFRATVRDQFAELPRDDPHRMPSNKELAVESRKRRIVKSRALRAHYAGDHKAFKIAPQIVVGDEVLRCPACVLEGKPKR